MQIRVDTPPANVRQTCAICWNCFKPGNVVGLLLNDAEERIGTVCEGCMNRSAAELVGLLVESASRFQGWADDCREFAREPMEAPPLEEFNRAVAADNALAKVGGQA